MYGALGTSTLDRRPHAGLGLDPFIVGISMGYGVLMAPFTVSIGMAMGLWRGEKDNRLWPFIKWSLIGLAAAPVVGTAYTIARL
jgi:hypothetical protein